MRDDRHSRNRRLLPDGGEPEATDGGEAPPVKGAKKTKKAKKAKKAKQQKKAGKDASPGRMHRAIKQVRREGRKVALIYAVVDAAFVTLFVNLLLRVTNPEWIPATVPWPRAIYASLQNALGAPPAPLDSAIVVGVALGLLTFVAEFLLRSRRPFVEQFERANPEIREALRTARDAVEDGANSRMAVRLYEDVLDGLRRSSSVGLVNMKRVFVTVLLVMVLSFASIQVAVIDLDIGDFGGEDATTGPDRDDDFEGLQDANSILGDPEDVTAGDKDLNATVSTQGGGDDGTGSAPSAYETSGFAGSGSVEGQEAGFAEQERLEDAELIRNYNLQIRTDDDE